MFLVGFLLETLAFGVLSAPFVAVTLSNRLQESILSEDWLRIGTGEIPVGGII